MAETKLMPCPFCGSEPLTSWEPSGELYIRCGNDDCLGASFQNENPESAVAAWDTRTPDPRMAAAQSLADALGGAQTQLNYVGYGDAWEREGTEGLREQISSALAAWEKLQ